MEELQVPTHRITVEMFTERGEVLSGALFAAESPFRLGAIDDLMRVLNDERTFLPFHTEQSGCTLVNKDHITRFRLIDPPDEWSDENNGVASGEGLPRPESCRLTLSDGTEIDGEISITTPRSLSRLVDKVNQAERFMCVQTGSGVLFVQTRHVLRID